VPLSEHKQFDDTNASLLIGKGFFKYDGFLFQGSNVRKTPSLSVGLVPDSGTNTAVNSFMAGLVNNLPNQGPDTLINVKQLLEPANFTVKFDGSKYKSFDLISLSFGLETNLLGKFINIAFAGEVRFVGYDENDNLLAGAGITKRFSPKIDSISGKVLPSKLLQVKFGREFMRASTIKVTLLDVSIPQVIEAGKTLNVPVSVMIDTVNLTAYPK
jgi:hypothetical protein